MGCGGVALLPTRSLVDLRQDVPLIGNSDYIFWMSIHAGEIFVRDRQKPPHRCHPGLINTRRVQHHNSPQLPCSAPTTTILTRWS